MLKYMTIVGAVLAATTTSTHATDLSFAECQRMQNKVFADSAAIEAESAKLNGERSETTKTDRSANVVLNEKLAALNTRMLTQNDRIQDFKTRCAKYL